MTSEHPDCTEDRKKLKGILSDYLFEDRLQQNLILNAYDEKIIRQLNDATDITLRSLQMADILGDNYGLTKEHAIWTVISWCYMLGYVEVADTLSKTFEGYSPTSNTTIITDTKNSYRESFDLKATYLAGIDFPSGKVRIELDGKMKRGDCTANVSKSPKRLRDLEGTWFDSQVYLDIKDGYYLAVFPWNYIGDLGFSTYRIISVE